MIDPISKVIGRRWQQAPAYLFSAFLIYIGVLTFLPNPEKHFGIGTLMPDGTRQGGWLWIYTNWPNDARFWGVLLAYIGIMKIIAVEFRTHRIRGWLLVAIFVAFVFFAKQVTKSADTIGPGTGMYLMCALLVAWWLSTTHQLADGAVGTTRSGA